MRIYPDLCCLKRPFDELSQERVRLEADAVLAILGAPRDELVFVHALAQDLENEQNPVSWRASRVRRWLEEMPLSDVRDELLASRTSELVELGFKGFDALHVASAELAAADVVVTCDERFLAIARRSSVQLRVRVTDPLSAAREVFA